MPSALSTPAHSARIPSLDAMRIIAATMVVCLHSPLPGSDMVQNVVRSLCYSAVPFFFSVSGYFFYRDAKADERTLARHTIVRLLRIYVAVMVAYIIIDVINYGGMEVMKREWEHVTPVDFFILNITPHCPVLWYVHAYIYMLIVTAALGRWPKVLAALLVLSAIGGMTIGPYRAFAPWAPEISDTNALACYCFFLTGYFVRRHNITARLTPKHTAWLAALTFAAMLMAPAEHAVLHSVSGESVSGSHYVGVMLACPLLLLTLLSRPTLLAPLAPLGRSYSMGIYLWHLAVLQCIAVRLTYNHFLALAPCIFIITLALCHVWKMMKRRLFAAI